MLIHEIHLQCINSFFVISLQSIVPTELLAELNELKALMITDGIEFRKQLDEIEKVYIERIQQLPQRYDLGSDEFDPPILIVCDIEHN